MGVCLCKEEGKRGSEPPYTRDEPLIEGNSNDSSFQQESEFTQTEVDNLILETLTVIRTKVDIEEDPPDSLIKLNTVAEREEGWIQLVKAFVYVIPMDDPLGPAVMSLFLDDCPLPTRETALRCVDFLDELEETDIKEHRNFMIVLGCLAGKLAGPNSVALLTDNILEHIIRNLSEEKPSSVVLFSLIALEKFSQTSENKSKIRKHLSVISQPLHPLVKLEKFVNEENDLTLRQIGFCAEWCLDNLLPVEGRKFSHTCVDQTNINVILNHNDVSEYLKLGPTGLTARCDSSSFESVRCTGQAHQGAWFYEVLLLSGGVMQIGWATKASKFLNYEGFGIGDDEYSQAYDGCRQLMWYNASNTDVSSTLPQWKAGDIVGCYMNIAEQYIMFYLNGAALGPYKQLFLKVSGDIFPAASFMAFQQCEFNFGDKPFRFPPSPDHPFQNFNQEFYLSPDEKIIWPRPVKLKRLQRISIHENTCTICYAELASSTLIPCDHSGFCVDCATELMKIGTCPICRANIQGFNQTNKSKDENQKIDETETVEDKL